MPLRMVRVEDHERPPPFRPGTNVGDDVGVGRRPSAQVRDPRVLGVVLTQRLDVERDDLPGPEQLADRGEVESAPAAVRAGLDDELGSRLDHDLLVDPEVQRVLERLRAEPRRVGPRVGQVEHVIGARDGGAVELLADAKGESADSSGQLLLHGRGILGGAAQAEDLEVAVRDPCDRTGRDRRPTPVELDDESVEHVAELVVRPEGQAPLADELGMPATVAIGRRQTARERLEERVGAGIVAARRQVGVLGAQERRERLRAERADDVDALERRRRAPGERQLEARGVEVAVEPGEGLTALAGVVRPARRRPA